MGLPSNYFQEVKGEFLTCEWSEANPDTGKTILVDSVKNFLKTDKNGSKMLRVDENFL